MSSDPTASESFLERFESMELSDVMMKALERAGYEEPSPVQSGVIPKALEGLDVIGQARTGTGKTAAFAIPVLEQLADPEEIHEPQAIVLVPTRELSLQVRDEFRKLAHGQGITIEAIYGGVSIKDQIDKLKRGVQVVVGTPGRVIDHIERGTLDLRQIWCTILDEADRMLDIGFRPDIEKILRRCKRSDRQTLLLSATMPPPIQALAEQYMYEPTLLNFSSQHVSGDTIDQFHFTIAEEHKFDLLLKLIEREDPTQAIVFCRTKRRTDQVNRKLCRVFDDAGAIHGDMSQGARNKVMQNFRGERLRFLVATDVIGRGIDVSSISHIINYDTPQDCDDYVHRIGRTGRMGAEGVAYTFVSREERKFLSAIEHRINRELTRDKIEGYEPTEDQAPPPAPPDSLMKRPKKKYRRGI